MNNLEETLRSAIADTAAEIDDGHLPPLRLPTGPGRAPHLPRVPVRRRGRRWTAPLAAAAAVLAVVAASVGITRLHATTPPAAESPAARAAALASVPPFYVTLTAYEAKVALVRSTETGKVIATIRPPHPYGIFNFVTGGGPGDQDFVLMAQRFRDESGPNGAKNQAFDNRTPGAFFALHVSPDGHVSRLTPLTAVPAVQAVGVSNLQLSPDGSKLALALQGHGMANRGTSIRVVNLHSGTSRRWVWPGRGWVGEFKPMWRSMSWQNDNRTLVFQTRPPNGNAGQVRVLDTQSPAGSLAGTRMALDFHGTALTGPMIANVLVTGDGSKLIGALESYSGSGPKHSRTLTRINEYSTRTGQLLRTLDPVRANTYTLPLPAQNVLWVSASGDAMVVQNASPAKMTSDHSAAPVVGVQTGNQFTPLPGPVPDSTFIAW